MIDFKNDIEKCLEVLNNGGLILYPTDTIWGIGCDATNETSVEKIFSLKKRSDKRSMIILVAEEKNIYNNANADKKIFEYLSSNDKPTTVIYTGAKNIAANLISDKTIAIRIVKDDFCKELIHQFKKPIVSTSANISRQAFPHNFQEVSNEIKNGVDYIVQHRQNDPMASEPSSIIRLDKEGNIEIIR